MDHSTYPFTSAYTAQASRRRNSPTTAYQIDGLNQQPFAEPWDGHPIFPVTTGYLNLSSTTSTTTGLPVPPIPLPATTGAFSQSFGPSGISLDSRHI